MGDFVLIGYLDPEEIQSFMEGIYSLGVRKARFGEPPVGYGEYLARVNYSDGRELYLGALHIELVEAGARSDIASVYSFDADEFNGLFAGYLE